jgi:recombination protein RecT
MSNEIVSADQFRAMKGFLESPTVIQQIGKIVTQGINPQRLVRQAVTLCSENPELLKCTQQSIILGVVKAAELGLELSGPLGHAYLVPRFTKIPGTNQKAMMAIFQVGWKGLVALAFRQGNVASMPVRCVHEHDRFEITFGDEQRLIHEPDFNKDRGNVIGYYAAVKYVNGGRDFEYMTKEQVCAHRDKYGGKGPGWSSSFDKMAMKTVLRQLCSRLSLCPEAQKQAMEEEYEELGVAPHRQISMKEAPEVQMLLDHASPNPFDGGPDPEDDPK